MNELQQLATYSIWQINHKLRQNNPFNLTQMYTLLDCLSDNGIDAQIQNVVNQSTGFWVWQLREIN